MKQTKVICSMVTEQEDMQIRNAAEMLGISKSDFLRFLILQKNVESFDVVEFVKAYDSEQPDRGKQLSARCSDVVKDKVAALIGEADVSEASLLRALTMEAINATSN